MTADVHVDAGADLDEKQENHKVIKAVLYVAACFIFIAAGLFFRLKQALYIGGGLSLISLFFVKEGREILKSKIFIFVCLVLLGILIRPGNYLLDRNWCSIILGAFLFGIGASVFLKDYFHLVVGLFPLALTCNYWYMFFFMHDKMNLGDSLMLNFHNSNNMGTLGAYGVMAALWPAVKTSSKVLKVLFSALGIFCAYMLYASFCRGGQLAFLLTFMCFLIAKLWKTPKKLIVTLIILAAAASMVLYSMPQHYFEKYKSMITCPEESTSGRLTIWKDALGAIKKYPWFGKYDFSEATGNQIWSAHNLYLAYLVRFGLPLGLSLLGFMFYAFYRMVKYKNFYAFLMLVFLIHYFTEQATSSLIGFFYFIPCGYSLGLTDERVNKNNDSLSETETDTDKNICELNPEKGA